MTADALRSQRVAMNGLRRGFTLIEILVVIVVIAVLASLVAPNVFKHVGEAKNVTARSQIEKLGAALDPLASSRTGSTLDAPAESHRASLMGKLGIHHTAGLVRYAIRQGVIVA